MRKDDFVARVLIRLCPEPDKADAAMDRAESLYARYQARGYGPRKASADDPKPRASVDWLSKLDEVQRDRFLGFWTRWNAVPRQHRAGDKNEAACAWGKLLPDEAKTALIYAAAEDNARQWTQSPPEGQTRIYAASWLNKRRFDGFEAAVPKAKISKAESPRLSRLQETLRAYEGMQRLTFDQHRADEIERLRQEISGLERLSGTH